VPYAIAPALTARRQGARSCGAQEQPAGLRHVIEADDRQVAGNTEPGLNPRKIHRVEGRWSSTQKIPGAARHGRKAGSSDGKAIGGCPALHFEDTAPTAAHLAASAAKPNL
jgi:hypothetical protein